LRTDLLWRARLSAVCRAWDAALLPLFHPGMQGVISPAELRKLKRLALEQADAPPDPNRAPSEADARRSRSKARGSQPTEAGSSRGQPNARPVFELPDGMLSVSGGPTLGPHGPD
jgi:hypothetical protein